MSLIEALFDAELHIGSATIEAREGMARILLDAFDAHERGETAPNRLA